MTPRIFTAPIDYAGTDRLNITRKSAAGIGLCLAPSTALLQRYHPRWGGKSDWLGYTLDYIDELNERVQSNPAPFAAIMKRGQVTLVCYCKSRSRCHRILAAAWLAARGAEYVGERGKRGILPPVQSARAWGL